MFPVRTLHIALPGSSSVRLRRTRTIRHAPRSPCSPCSLRYRSLRSLLWPRKADHDFRWTCRSSCTGPCVVLLWWGTTLCAAHLQGHRHGHLKGEGSAHPPPTAPLPSPPTAYIPQLQSCMQLGMAQPAFNPCCCLAAASWNLLS